jgi:hypothetical protein
MIDYEEVLREKIVVGTPDAVVRRLHAIREELRLDGILAELNCGSRIPLAKVVRSLELLCRDVIGAFRAAAA